jgi:RNA polymerase sigma factor (sigma-70 family)
MQALDTIPTDTSREAEVASAIRAERPRLLDFIRGRVRFAEDAEDIVQDVLYQLVASEAVSEPIEKFTSWLFTVARNRIIDWYRKRRPEPVSRLRGDAGEEGSESLLLDSLLADPADTPESVYLRERVWEELADALEELPAKQRQAFVMHELEGMSFAEIAEETGVGVPTLLSRKRYAVAYLRERLQDLYDEIIQP